MAVVPFSALVDATTSALLTLTFRTYIIAFLAESEPDVECVTSINFPNYLKEFAIADGDPLKYPEWTWTYKARLFQPIPKGLLTESLRKKSLLAVKKSIVLAEMVRVLTQARHLVINGIPMQETVYLTKKIQAQRFKDEGYPDEKLLNFPYVLQFAEFANLSGRAAADEILLKARFDDDLLLKTEYFRLKYFNILKNTTEIALVDKVGLDFREEFYKILWSDHAACSV